MSYKSYYNVQPCQSKMLQAKWDKRHYETHLKKLSEMQPQIDTRAPKTYIHMHLKLNKIRLEEERLYIIERDNRLLLEKMSNTMRTRGRIDNVNPYELRSLNRIQRQRELLRVTRENQHFMQRIMRRKPEYNNVQLEKDWQRNLACMNNLTNFPKIKTEKDKKKTTKKTNDDQRSPRDSDRSKINENREEGNEENHVSEEQTESKGPPVTESNYEDDFTEEADEENGNTAIREDDTVQDTTEDETTIAEDLPVDKVPIKTSSSPEKKDESPPDTTEAPEDDKATEDKSNADNTEAPVDERASDVKTSADTTECPGEDKATEDKTTADITEGPVDDKSPEATTEKKDVFHSDSVAPETAVRKGDAEGEVYKEDDKKAAAGDEEKVGGDGEVVVDSEDIGGKVDTESTGDVAKESKKTVEVPEPVIETKEDEVEEIPLDPEEGNRVAVEHKDE